MIRLLLAAMLSWSWIGPATAQEVEAGDMVRGGMQAIQMIDQGKTGELWDGATAATRKRVARAEFIDQVASSRAPLGAPRMRTWVAVNRQVVADPDHDTTANMSASNTKPASPTAPTARCANS